MIPILGSTLDAIYERQRSLVRVGALKLDGRGRGGGIKATPQSIALLIIAMLASDSPRDAGARAKKIARARPADGFDPVGGGASFADTLAWLIDNRDAQVPQYPEWIMVSHGTPFATIEWASEKRGSTAVFYYADRSQKRPTAIQKQAVIGGAALLFISRELWNDPGSLPHDGPYSPAR